MIRMSMALSAGVLVVCIVSVRAHAQVQRVDGSTFPVTMARLPSGVEQPITNFCKALPTLEDGWTADSVLCGTPGPASVLLREAYKFVVDFEATPVTFVTRFRLAPRTLTDNVTVQVAQDLFILPRKPRTAQNPEGEDFTPRNTPPILFIDDVVFPQVSLTGSQGVQEFLAAVSIPVQLINDFIYPHDPGLAAALDWFVCADVDVSGSRHGQRPAADLDGNGYPDVCLEMDVPGFLVRREGVDELGAGLLHYLLNRAELNLAGVEVDEPQAVSLAPGSLRPFSPEAILFGESRRTRPWSFCLVRSLGR